MRVTAVYVTARRGAQRLRKATRGGHGSGYICYVAAIFFFGPSSHVSYPGDMNIHIAHAQYACYRTLYSAVLTRS